MRLQCRSVMISPSGSGLIDFFVRWKMGEQFRVQQQPMTPRSNGGFQLLKKHGWKEGTGLGISVLAFYSECYRPLIFWQFSTCNFTESEHKLLAGILSTTSHRSLSWKAFPLRKPSRYSTNRIRCSKGTNTSAVAIHLGKTSVPATLFVAWKSNVCRRN
ncbi:hypothetical protein OIU74_019317 [Salix koriyanagi]|uniref:G-patch domain-containing protein n=1 Tax=Salix koriyanagi TaxID=2511006 RepID=A0A9Q1AJ92_9ROSI|nr:hypothetical protein OIU74_019317 [Salix koriyanagi]